MSTIPDHGVKRTALALNPCLARILKVRPVTRSRFRHSPCRSPVERSRLEPAVKADRGLLERFRCTADDGPDYERVVQRYFRVQAIRHAGTPNSKRTDHRLLLLFDNGALVAAGSHRLGDSPSIRQFGFAAVDVTHQGRTLTNGARASDTLWQVVVNDMLTRPGDSSSTVVARVHPDNDRSLAFCSRIGLTPIEPDHNGLIICAGPLAPAPRADNT
jgi:hypothetical protein